MKHEQFPESILVRTFMEKVDVDEIIRSWEYLIEHDMVTDSTRGVINDLSVCSLEMDIEKFHKLSGYLKQSPRLRGIKLAVICSDPKIIIFPVLGEMEIRDLKIRPFSTQEAATDWIMNG